MQGISLGWKSYPTKKLKESIDLENIYNYECYEPEIFEVTELPEVEVDVFLNCRKCRNLLNEL